ncbi:MAG: MCE family protein [Saprospiraceae bacterium]|nr:MAG: mammalian cell entry related domain protein [Candidatus Parvibacillus calidus]MCC7150158.1 MCE family protein [Saprospiraceae bacterium]
MKKEVKIGILAIVALFIVIFGLKFLKGQNVFSSKQTFYSDFADVNKLTVGTPILIHGFQVGSVVDIYLKPSNPQLIEVEMQVNKDIKVPKSTIVEIRDVGMMGAKAIFLTYDIKALNDLAQSGDFLKGKTKGMLGSMLGDPAELQKYLSEIQQGAGGVMDTIVDYFKRIDQSQGVGLALANLQHTIENLRLITGELNVLLHNSNSNLQATFGNLNSITGNINNKNKEIASLLENLNSISNQVNNAGLDNTIQSANTTITTLNNRMNELKTTLEGADKAINGISSVLTKVNNGEGTLGKLVNDNDLYLNLERTSKQLDLLMQDLRLNPKRYVNVSVFGKKQKSYNVPEHDPANPILDSLETNKLK